MNARTAVIDWSGNYEENCIQLGRDLGKDKIRRALFNAVYGRGDKPRSKKQLMAAAGLQPARGQQAQNQLDYLYGCGLIERDKNDSAVSDGSRNVYRKDQNVRIRRKKIVRYADNPSLAKSTPTKRNVTVRGVQTRSVTRRTLKRQKHLSVLYLMANPLKRKSLRLDLEVSEVSEEIQRSKYSDNITLRQSPAANLKTILRSLNDHRPKIVHFSGHGDSTGLAGDDRGSKRTKVKFLDFEILGDALRATDTKPDVVLLNACNSAGARTALLGSTKVLIVMRERISDVAAIAFSTQFYSGIASGQPVKAAFDQGIAAIKAVSLSEAKTPVLLSAASVNPAKLVLT